MKLVLAIALVATAACRDDDIPDLPINPPTGSGSPVVGKGVTGVPPGTIVLLSGRVCLITVNAFALAQCATTGAGNFSVALGGATVVTADDGTFVIRAPVSPGQVFQVTGDTIVPAAQAVQAINIIPAFDTGLFTTLLTTNGISVSPTMGSVMASVTNNAGQPVAGVTATSNPTSASGPFFDGAQPSQFSQNETGNSGIVFFPGLTTIGPTAINFTQSSGVETTVDGVQVFDGGITFVPAPLP